MTDAQKRHLRKAPAVSSTPNSRDMSGGNRLRVQLPEGSDRPHPASLAIEGLLKSVEMVAGRGLLPTHRVTGGGYHLRFPQNVASRQQLWRYFPQALDFWPTTVRAGRLPLGSRRLRLSRWRRHAGLGPSFPWKMPMRASNILPGLPQLRRRPARRRRRSAAENSRTGWSDKRSAGRLQHRRQAAAARSDCRLGPQLRSSTRHRCQRRERLRAPGSSQC